MANELIIPFGTRALDKAKATIKEMGAALREAAKSIADVDARKAFLKDAKQALNERKAELIQGAKRTDRLDAAAQGRRGDLVAGLGIPQAVFDKAATSAVVKILGVGQRLGHLGGGLAALLTKDDPTGSKGLQIGLHGLAATGIPIVAQVAGIVSQVVDVLDAQAAKRQERFAVELRAQIARSLEEANTAERYRKDEQFKRRQNLDAQLEYISRTAHGFEPRGARLADGDF